MNISAPVLVIVAHGSRHAVANDEVKRLASEIARATSGEFSYVGVGFLECSEPSIPQALKTASSIAIKHNVSKILIYPYFLVAGGHVSEDIPSIVATEQANYSGLTLELLPYLGKDAALGEVILAQLKRKPHF